MNGRRMHIRRSRGALFAAVITACASLAALQSGPAEANHPQLYFPALAGTQWTIAGGYNTPTHTLEDPHALDLVRIDAPTEGSAVLAPAAGRVSFGSGSSCLTLRDSHSMLILICHVYPVAGMKSGATVIPGQQIGTVAPAGEAGNNGLAHIHLAIHRNFTRGQLQTIPLSEAYALEGRNLPDTSEGNAYAGEEFTASLQLLPPPVSTTPPATPPPASPGPSVSEVSIIPNSPYTGGINSIVIMGGGVPATVVTRIAANSKRPVLALWVYRTKWTFFLPTSPGIDGGLGTLSDTPVVSAFAVLG